MRLKLLMLAAIALPTNAVAQVVPHPSLGVAEGRCRPNEPGPAFMINATGLKDRAGRLRVEVYPPNDADFLNDDAKLINAGKTFRRGEIDVPSSGAVQLCIRVPGPGTYAVAVLHDRDRNRKFGLSSDGIGFPGNPRLSFSKPKASSARAVAGSGVTPINVCLKYRKGLLSFGHVAACR